MLSADPLFQEFFRRSVAERGVLPFSIVPPGDFLRGVERFNVVEQVGLRLGLRTVAGAMHPLILQTVEETLRRRVVPTV